MGCQENLPVIAGSDRPLASVGAWCAGARAQATYAETTDKPVESARPVTGPVAAYDALDANAEDPAIASRL